METKQIEKMTDAEYFDLEAISASQIKTFDKGAYWFWKSTPFNHEKEPEKESDALIFGKLCHCLLLEPEKFDEEYLIYDFGKLRTNKKYEEAKLLNPNKIIVNQEEVDHAKKMMSELQNHKLAGLILDGATAEMPYIWMDKNTGLLCKCKMDAIKRTKAGIVLIDYKTSSDIEGLINWPQKLQYPLQADFYCRAVKEKYGEDPIEFVFIIQSNKVGEEDIIAVCNVEFDTQQVAHDIVDHHLIEIKERLDNWNETHDKSIWSAYPNRVEMRYSNWFMDRGE